MVNKVPVGERALLARINRKLAADELRIRKNREGSRAEQDMGVYFMLNTHINGAVEYHVNLEETGRELGVLQAWEEVAWDEGQ